MMRPVLILAGVLMLPQGTLPPPRVNFPASNPAREIADALSQARGDHKYVLLDFGADWCVDCRVLEEAFRDPAIAPFLKLHFHVVRIDVGEFFKGGDAFKNRSVAQRYGVADPNETGVPVLVTLDPDGQVVYGTSRVHWAAARQFNLGDVLLYLRKTLPPTTVSRLETFTEHGVRVEITYDHDIFGLNWLSARFMPTAAGFQLYGSSLAKGGVNGAGRPTRFDLTSPGGVRTRGQTFESADATPERVEILKQTFPMYPAGPVVLRIPITRPEPSASKTEVSITYMACGPTGCLPPVEDKRIRFTLKSQ
ncbi:MAG TPA: thioredoxin family protein [Vicinamibacterales bacterium]|nr:thioredoxin family protein [Vicinamibacterales bacterium]